MTRAFFLHGWPDEEKIREGYGLQVSMVVESVTLSILASELPRWILSKKKFSSVDLLEKLMSNR